ncbi:AAA family ATPase [Nakamurella leprariae]|uniref:AAA family ATPase n=1 Tax=Nakamurella leprariae TaxID=2803911 RepID=UPI002E2D0CB1|nr:MoxR family ATPase [Nakamurella leprariae]
MTQEVETGRQAGAAPNSGPAIAPHEVGAPVDGPVDQTPLTPEGAAELAGRLADGVGQVLLGKPEAVRLALIGVLAEGHLLVEDVPGTGKTSLAKAMARVLGGAVSRVQFTPDLMPGDVTGSSVFDRNTAEFEFRPGPVFANVVIADEINRASPKTQSALLECMEERQVTVDGTTYQLARPFLVVATQNPVEMEGTYPLPEAQRDRFLARMSIGYPDPTTEVAMLSDRDRTDPLALLRPVATVERTAQLIDAVTRVHLAPALRSYLVEIVAATRGLPDVRLGASPRAVLHLARAAKASAAMDGRTFVVPDDIQRLAVPVLAHRLILTVEAHSHHRSAEEIVAVLVSRIRVPRGSGG